MPTNVCLMVTSSTSLTVSFQEPLSVNAAVVTRYKGTGLQIFFLCSVLRNDRLLENQLCILYVCFPADRFFLHPIFFWS